MIKSFQCKETEKLFHGRFSTKLPQAMQRSAARTLEIISAATVLDTLRVPPSNHLEELHGKRKGQHSIRINKQWRICFIWKGSDAHDVEI
jgi:toxin HigB-1